ncbi:MAG: dihydrolipoamide acetyltransferase family protein [bacterium]
MATKILMPKLSDTMEEGVILKWLKQEGEKVKQGEILVEIESDKADMELEAYDSGVLKKIVVQNGGKAPIGALIGVIAEADEDIYSLLNQQPSAGTVIHSTPPASETAAQTVSGVFIPEAASESSRVKASPLAKRLAREKNIPLSALQGSGPHGRVIKRDIEQYTPIPQTKPSTPMAPILSGATKEVELSSIRKTIAKRMAESKATAPHFYVTIEVDMEPAIAFREQINSISTSKISFTDIIIKASAFALMLHPNINATYAGNSMRQYGYAHIGVAVALEEGLVTPILRNCEQKSISQINGEFKDLVGRARSRKLKPEEYLGATFTISNLGMFGVEDFVAIINPPEGAILAIGAILEKPVVKKGQFAIGHTMKITLSSDHRIIDGVVAAKFLQDLKKLLENPNALVSF